MTLEDPITIRAIFPGFHNHAERRVPLRSNNSLDVPLATYTVTQKAMYALYVTRHKQIYPHKDTHQQDTHTYVTAGTHTYVTAGTHTYVTAGTHTYVTAGTHTYVTAGTHTYVTAGTHTYVTAGTHTYVTAGTHTYVHDIHARPQVYTCTF